MQKRGAVSWLRHVLKKGMDQNVSWKITYTKIALACNFVSIENITVNLTFFLSVENEFYTIPVQNELL